MPEHDSETNSSNTSATAPTESRDGLGADLHEAAVALPTSVGQSVLGSLTAVGGVSILTGKAAAAIPKTLLGKRGKQLAWKNLFYQMVRVGVKAVPIVALVVFCIGAILSLQIVPILRQYGAADEVSRIIAIAMFRELGPLIGAITLTGFAGASIAAEIGTMTVSEEIEAMETHAIDPIKFLVVPRMIATALMTVCLAIIANYMGVLGGMVVSVNVQDLSSELYMQRTFDSINLKDFGTGLIKAFVFGTIISGLACWLGLSVRGGAQGVGEATTRTVVMTVVALAVVDLMFTWLFFSVGV